ncbi:MAG: NHL repeat-containing protein, partial [Thermoguttaceae bacterium]
GLPDQSERPLAGWTVYRDENQDGARDENEPSAVTSADGSYLLTGVPTGLNMVSVETRPHWQQTSPNPTASQGRLFAIWSKGSSGTATIVELSPKDGAILNQFAAPGILTTEGLQGLALGPDRLYYVEGETQALFELDLDSGSIIDVHSLAPLPSPGTISGLAYLEGKLYMVQHDKDQILVWDTVQESFGTTLPPRGSNLGVGLTGADSEGLLFCSNNTGQVLGINPATGSVERTFNTTLGALKGGMAWLNGELIVGPLGTSATVYRLDPDTGQSRGTLTLGGSQLGSLSGLGGDGAVATGSASHRFVEVASGQPLDNVNFGYVPQPYTETLSGTAFADQITITTNGTEHRVTINGTVRTFDPATATKIEIDALGGNDRVTLVGTDGAETATLAPGSAELVGQGWTFQVVGVEDAIVQGGAGSDTVTLAGSTGANRLHSYADYSCLTDSARSFSHRVLGFETVTASVPAGEQNYAFLFDSPADDALDGSPASVRLRCTDGSSTRTAAGFRSVYVYATLGGRDTASLVGAANGGNRLYSYPDRSVLTDMNRSFYLYSQGFDSVTANSPGSNVAFAYVYDSPGDDTLQATPTSTTMNRADSWCDLASTGFQRVYAYANAGGSDSAELTGTSAGGNSYRAYPLSATLTNSAISFYHYAAGFRSVTATGAQSGTVRDVAYLYDSPGDDTLRQSMLENGKYQGASLTGPSGAYTNRANYFDWVYARSSDRGTADSIEVQEELLAYRLIRMGTW